MEGQCFALTGPIVIGSELPASYLVNDRAVSKSHARVFPHKGGFAVDDLKSRLGTLVNGERLVAPLKLKPGDVIKVGKTEITFSDQPPAKPAAPDGQEIVRTMSADQDVFLAKPVSDQGAKAWPRLLGLYAVLEAVSSLEDPEEVARAVLKQLFALISAARGAIVLVEPTGEWKTLCAMLADGSNDSSVKISRTLLKHVAENRVALVTSDAVNDPRLAGSGNVEASVFMLQIRSAVSVPLMAKGRVLGVMQLLFDMPGQLVPEEDVRWLTGVAHQAATAIESASLHLERKKMIQDLLAAQQELQTRVEHLRILNEIERSMASNHDVESFLDGITGEAVGLLSANGGALLLAPASGGPLEISHLAGDRELAREVQESPLGRRVVEAVQTSGKVLRKCEPGALKADLGPALAEKVGSVIAVPLTMTGDGKESNLGVLQLFNAETGAFAEADEDLMKFLAAQITSAMGRKQLLVEKANTDRLSALGNVAGSIMHDIRNPLTRIRGYAELVARPNITDESGAKYAKIMTAAVDRCANMASEILHFAKGDSTLKMSQVSAQAFFDDIIILLENDIQNAQLKLEKDIEYTGPLNVDADKMNRVIFNLSTNAIRVLKPGGVLRLSCKAVENEIEIRVSDNGPGIPEELLPRLFQPFATMGTHGGTGLGLSIVRSIVKSHGGRIFLDDASAPGATFVIRLPSPAA